MELDELKQTWQQATIEKTSNKDIMELIHQKSYGPVAALKRVFRKQIVAMSLIPLILVVTNLNNVSAVFTSILFWCYVAFCIGIIVFAGYNYHIAGKMEEMHGEVKQNLEQQVNLLEKRLHWELIGLRAVLIFFVILLETVPYVQHYRMLDKWHSLSPLIRFGAYAALAITQYVVNRRLSYHKVGRHLVYLKGLISEMR
ncbi:MAG: hypothetical protein JO301_07350 [Chitinophagaceae bacterium]|nr:hypothetical protein [Chitinophagaceae bacterium]